MNFITFENVHKKYWLGKVPVYALIGVNFTVSEGEFVTMVGPSGSGKSTLLNLLGLIDSPSEGTVWFDEVKIDFRKDAELTRIRKEKIGFIFQHFNLIPILNIQENIEFPLQNSRLSLSERKKRVNGIIDAVGLSGLERRMPNRISGGQQQRVAIGRALVTNPRMIIADEPTANLDSQTGKLIVELLHSINRNSRTTVILATHDPEIIRLSDHIMRVHDGQVLRSEKDACSVE